MTMANRKRCLAQLSLSGSWGSEHFWPGLEVDLGRVLVPARTAIAAKGDEGTDGYVVARPASAAFTVGDAIAGREECFEDVDASVQVDAGSSPDGVTHTDVPADTDFSEATVRPIKGKAASAAATPQQE